MIKVANLIPSCQDFVMHSLYTRVLKTMGKTLLAALILLPIYTFAQDQHPFDEGPHNSGAQVIIAEAEENPEGGELSLEDLRNTLAALEGTPHPTDDILEDVIEGFAHFFGNPHPAPAALYGGAAAA